MQQSPISAKFSRAGKVIVEPLLKDENLVLKRLLKTFTTA